MRRHFTALLIGSIVLGLLWGETAQGQTFNVVTYSNNRHAGGSETLVPNPAVMLHAILYGTGITLNSGDTISLNDNLDDTIYGPPNLPNGINDLRGITISGLKDNTGDLWLTFINNTTVSSTNGERIIQSTGARTFPIYNITWQTNNGNPPVIDIGHLRIEEQRNLVNTTHILRDGYRSSSNTGAADPLDLTVGSTARPGVGYRITAGALDVDGTRGMVNGGGAARIVGHYNSNGAADGVGASFGTLTAFESNLADFGGALFARKQNILTDYINGDRSGIITFEKQVTFRGNRSNFDGGGIYATEDSSIYVYSQDSYEDFYTRITNGTTATPIGYTVWQHRNAAYGLVMTNNTAGHNGGGLAVSTNGLFLSDSIAQFSGNTAGTATTPSAAYSETTVQYGDGGAIYARDYAEIQLLGGARFTSNTAHSAGGAIAVHNGALVRLTGALSFVGNTATGQATLGGFQNVTRRNGNTIANPGSFYDATGALVQNVGIDPAAGYGGAVFLRGDSGLTATLDLLNVTGSIGDATTGGNVNRHGNPSGDAVANSFFQYENSLLHIAAAPGQQLRIYDPFASRGLVLSDLGAGTLDHNNTITFGHEDGAASGAVRIWGDSSDSAFLPASSDPRASTWYEKTHGGLNYTYVDDGTAYGTYADVYVYSGSFELMDGATKPGGAGETVAPTEFGSNRLYVDGLGAATSGDFTVGNGLQTDATSVTQLPSVILHKFTGTPEGEATQYTTLRANSLTMDGGVVKFTGTSDSGEVSATTGDDTAKIYLNSEETDIDLKLTQTITSIDLYAPSATDGTGHGGTFYIDDEQEYDMYFGLRGDGNFTKAGAGILRFKMPYFLQYYNVHKAWQPEFLNTAPVMDVLLQTYTQAHRGLTILTGGTLEIENANTLADIKPFGPGDFNPDDKVSDRTVKMDYRNQLIFEGISRGVVLAIDPLDPDSSATKAMLDISATSPVWVYAEAITPVQKAQIDAMKAAHPDRDAAGLYPETFEYNGQWYTAPQVRSIMGGPLYDDGDGGLYGPSIREQTFAALAGDAGTTIKLNDSRYTSLYRDPSLPDDQFDPGSEVILTISQGWGAGSDGNMLAGILEGEFAATEFEGGASHNHYFSGTITGGGKIIKRGSGALGLAAANELTQSTELQGGALYLGHAEAIGVYNESLSREIGLLEVFGADQATYNSLGMSQVGNRSTGAMNDKIFGIRGDSDYTLQVRIVADGDYVPDDPGQGARESWLDRPAGTLTIDANTKALTFANLSSSENGGAIYMKQPELGNTWERGADLYFNPGEGYAYRFLDNTSAQKGGAIYAGGNLHLVGNMRFSNNISETGAIYVAGGTDAAHQAVVELSADTGHIAFHSNNGVAMTFVQNTDINITGTFNTYFDAPIRVEGYERGSFPNDSTGVSLDVQLGSSEAFVQFGGRNDFNGDVRVDSGIFRLVSGAYFGEAQTFVTADRVATLAGNGTLAAKTIDLAGVVSPDSQRYAIPTDLAVPIDIEHDPLDKRNVGTLNLHGANITLGGEYIVDLSYDAAGAGSRDGHVSDKLVTQGALNITSTSTLTVNADLMNDGEVFRNGATYYIIESDQAIDGSRYSAGRFMINDLPRFLELVGHGFTSNRTRYYLEFGASGWTFLDPAKTRNQRAVAGAFNEMLYLDELDATFDGLIDAAAMLDDDGVRRVLQEFSPDVRSNSLTLGFSEPWRPVFQRMRHRDPGYRVPMEYRGQYRVPFKSRPREVWFEGYYRGMDTYGDDNARDYGTSRSGFVLGIEKEIHDDIRVGGIFGFASPYLFQDGGKVDANDFQGGLYLLMNLPAHLEFRGYVGMSGLNYDYQRHENPFTDAVSAQTHNSRYKANFNGQALAFSAELSRPLKWTPWFTFLPLAGIDHQVSRQDAFTEKGGKYNQAFDKAEFSQTTVRFGVNSQMGENESFLLRTRLQYGIRLQDTAPMSRSRFADLAESPVMSTEGIVLGSNYVNLGIGTEFYLNPRGTSRMFFDYDADITERSIVNTGGAGVTFQW